MVPLSVSLLAQIPQRLVQGGCSWQLGISDCTDMGKPRETTQAQRRESYCSLWRWKVASKVAVSVCQQWEATGRWWLRLEKSEETGLKEAYSQ